MARHPCVMKWPSVFVWPPIFGAHVVSYLVPYLLKHIVRVICHLLHTYHVHVLSFPFNAITHVHEPTFQIVRHEYMKNTRGYRTILFTTK